VAGTGEESIRDLLIEIRTMVDVLVRGQGDHETRLRALEQAPTDPEVGKLSERLRLLERQWWMLLGAATAAGGVAGRIAGVI
jgi:hypothetical protein